MGRRSEDTKENIALWSLSIVSHASVSLLLCTEADVVTTATDPARALKFGREEIWFDHLQMWTLKLQGSSSKKGFARSVNGAQLPPSSKFHFWALQLIGWNQSEDKICPLPHTKAPISSEKEAKHATPPRPPTPSVIVIYYANRLCVFDWLLSVSLFVSVATESENM